MKKYIITKQENKIVDIASTDLIFIENESHYGLQCNYTGDSEKYLLIRKKCLQVAQLIREIDILNKL